MNRGEAAKPQSRQERGSLLSSWRLGGLAALPLALLTPRVGHAECVETGTATVRPAMVDSFPSHGTSGYAATLHVVVTHGKGESVLPHGLELQAGSDMAKALKAAGFALPDQDGGAAARLTIVDDPKTGKRETTLDLPLVVLPENPGRHTLSLPPLPVSVARASSDVVTLSLTCGSTT